MSDSEVDVAADRVAAAFTSAVDDLLSLRLTPLPGLALVELLGRVETQLRRMACFDHALIAAVLDSNACAEVGARTTACLLVQTLRISPTEAGARVRAARELGPRTDFTGGPMEPKFAHVAAAQAAGSISAAHARVITGCVDDLPSVVRAEHGQPLEQFLIDQACAHAPDYVAKTAKHALTVLDPDGTLSSDEDHHRRRGFTLLPNPDGSSDVRGRLTPQATAIVLAALDPLASPRPATTGDATGCGATTDTGAATGSDAADSAASDDVTAVVQDPRTYPQRMHDALQDACERLLASGTLPDNGGVPSVLVITMTAEQFATATATATPTTGTGTATGTAGTGTGTAGTRRGTGTATTGHGHPITVADALNLSDQADVIPVVLDAAGGVISYGRMRRHATAQQRRALAARDGGCSFPECDAPPSWTQAHHVKRWEHGGLTDLANLTLVCGYHHREHERQGWQCQMTNGVPHWLPPWWIDAERTPLRNTTHHIQRFIQPDAA